MRAAENLKKFSTVGDKHEDLKIKSNVRSVIQMEGGVACGTCQEAKCGVSRSGEIACHAHRPEGAAMQLQTGCIYGAADNASSSA